MRLNCDAQVSGLVYQIIEGESENGSRQLGAWNTSSINKRRASSSGLEPVTALDLFRPAKNTRKTPQSISYSPVNFLCLISSDIGDRADIEPDNCVQEARCFLVSLLALDGLTIPRKMY